MDVKFEFYLPVADLDRLFVIKNKNVDKRHLTGNEYAAELLHRLLHELCPQAPEIDGAGNYIIKS